MRHVKIVCEHVKVDVKVVNDLSERTVKLMQDFATSVSNDEEQKQFLLLVVEFHRKEFLNFQRKL